MILESLWHLIRVGITDAPCVADAVFDVACECNGCMQRTHLLCDEIQRSDFAGYLLLRVLSDWKLEIASVNLYPSPNTTGRSRNNGSSPNYAFTIIKH